MSSVAGRVRHSVAAAPSRRSACYMMHSNSMSTQFVRAHRFAFAALTLLGCGDDTASSAAGNSADAGSDAAAEGGNKSSQQSAGHSADKLDKADAGRPAEREPSPSKAKDAGQPVEDDAEQEVTLRFRAQVGDAAFACGRVYTDQGSTRQTVTARDLRMFIQDVALIDDAGQEVAVKLDTRDPWQTPDVALLDFEDSSGDCLGTAETNREITGVVPNGKYRAVRFSHGVPEQLNHADPKTFPAPLQTPGMSWNWLLGLRFVRIELGTQAAAGVALDTDAGADPGSFSLHVGSTGCAGNQNAGTIRCAKPNRSRVELKDFDLDKSEIVFDVSALLEDSDLSKTVECHSGTPNCESMFRALGVDYATGEPGTEHRAFRLK
jgi:uncharacterized repeat protein (TIGR04052 family)